MNKTIIIAKREYITRVRKKSFIIMTLVGPLSFSLLMIIPILLSTLKVEKKVIQVVDESHFLEKKSPSNEIQFIYSTKDLIKTKEKFLEKEEDGILYIPSFNLQNPVGFKFFSKKNPSLETQRSIEQFLNNEIESLRMKEAGIDKNKLEQLKSHVSIETISLSKEGETSNSAIAATGAGFLFSFLIYMFIFIYGAQVMRGVIEEKVNRIIEVVVSSIKPFQLMMGKIIGIAAVGFTQLLIWIILSSSIYTIISASFQKKSSSIEITNSETTQLNSSATTNQQAITQIKSAISTINIPLLIGCFLFYFIGGYLLYGALFAAIGSAVDSESDTQQFMLPVTIPLVACIISAQFISRDPDGGLAFWMSIIPLFSPIIMMLRLPFGVPIWQLILSMSLLIGGFVFSTWFAGRIYRIGILMYGKKTNYKEMMKWLFMKW